MQLQLDLEQLEVTRLLIQLQPRVVVVADLMIQLVLLVDLEEEQRAWDLIILADHQTKQILLAGQLDLAIREEIKADGRNKPEAEQAEAEQEEQALTKPL